MSNRNSISRLVSLAALCSLISVSAHAQLGLANARWTSAGAVDTTFNGGKFITPLDALGGGATVSYADSTGSALDNQGRLAVGGMIRLFNGKNQVLVARYTTTGALDTAFNGSGVVRTGVVNATVGAVNGLTIDSSNRVLVAGYLVANAHDNFCVTRYNANGTLDSTFNHDGMAINGVANTHVQAKSIAMAPGGKIVAAGLATLSISDLRIVVMRYNDNGGLDTTFGNGGIVITNLNNFNWEFATDVAVQSDGKVVVSVDAEHFNAGPQSRFVAVRYNVDGTLDTGFGSGGQAVVHFPTATSGYEYSESISIDSNGRILLGGTSAATGSPNVLSVTRLNSNGARDTTFASNGYFTFGFGPYSSGITRIKGFGSKVLMSGEVNAQGLDNFIALRLTSSGAVDPTFNGGGVVSAKVSAGKSDRVTGLTFDIGGRVTVTGYSF